MWKRIGTLICNKIWGHSIDYVEGTQIPLRINTCNTLNELTKYSRTPMKSFYFFINKVERKSDFNLFFS